MRLSSLLQDRTSKFCSIALSCLIFYLKRSYFKWQIDGIWINYFFSRPPHFLKYILISLSIKIQLTSDKKICKTLLLKGLSFKLQVLILWESKLGYIDWRIGGLSGDVDEDFK